jgi:glyoxylase-like metal-dependent hydrolase (beta-lactamase superfamily II)
MEAMVARSCRFANLGATERLVGCEPGKGARRRPYEANDLHTQLNDGMVLMRLPAILVCSTLLGIQARALFEAVDGAHPALEPGVSRGAAWGDLDGDGDADLYVTRSSDETAPMRNVLYRNDEGRFTVVEGMADPGPGAWQGAAWVDVDGDGDLDLNVVGRNGAGAVLYENVGGGRLVERDVPTLGGRVRSASMACWADVDGDRHLDAFIAGYGEGRNELFRGSGQWQFEVAPLPDAAVGQGAARACIWTDLDGDGLPELVVANARQPNLLLRNQGEMRFVVDAATGLEADLAYGYGVSSPDVDGDGRRDVFVANFDAGNSLFLGRASGRLQEVDLGDELQSAASKGHVWGDLDLDGNLDLYLGSGTPAPRMLNRLYLGEGGGRFRASDQGELAEHADTSAAVAGADFDLDGDLDLFVANWGGSGSLDRLYRNTSSGRSWLRVSLEGTESNRMGVGARASVQVTIDGERRWLHRWLDASTGYAGQDEPVLHFGLGEARVVDSLIVAWPSGTVDRFGDVPSATTLTVREGRSGPPAATRALADRPVFDELCLRGELDLGARLQGSRPSGGEWYPTEWCVVTSDDSERVRFSAAGRSNPDMEGTWALSYPSSDRVRVINAGAPPDLDFVGASARDEARSVRRMDPARLVAELDRHPEWVVAEREEGWREVRWPGSDAVTAVQIREGRLRRVETAADLPLRGRVPVVWEWAWPPEAAEATLELSVDGRPVFRAVGERRSLTQEEADAIWQPSGGEPPREIPGSAWPAQVDMRTETLSPGVHMVRGVRTGFHHLVVETEEGLVVADAPAGWVELHQLPPRDLVPGLGISGLSERFIDHLGRQWPGVPIRAVVLTHAHDDHSGGARAFAAAGATVYAPADVAAFLEAALNRGSMPEDRLTSTVGAVRILPVDGVVVLPDARRPVELVSVGVNPHVGAALGVHVPSARVFFQSDLHVPSSDSASPRRDRLRTECWFADWATRRLPPETVVHNSHGTVALAVNQLAAYLTGPECQSPAGAG